VTARMDVDGHIKGERDSPPVARGEAVCLARVRPRARVAGLASATVAPIDDNEHDVLGSQPNLAPTVSAYWREDRMKTPSISLLTVLAACVALTLPGTAAALDSKVTIAQLSFHISHPAKKYDAKLLQGGASATAHFDPSDISRTSVDASFQVEYFNSDNELRDSHMMEVLEGIIFPEITWKAAAIGAASAPFTAGTHKLDLEGTLTVHGVSRKMQIPVQMEVASNGLVDVTSTFSISLESFEIERPKLVFVKIADDVPVTIRMVFPVGPELLAPPVAAAAEESAAAAAAAPEPETAAQPAAPESRGEAAGP
jgi:polyisoprenoid-binding protein YceI